MRPWLIAAVVVGCDQLTKQWLMRAFEPGQSFPLIPPILSLTYVQNTGAAFGLFKGQTVLFAALSVVAAVWIIVQLVRHRPQDVPIEFGLSLVLGGALGNLIDRLHLGYVVDFLDVGIWPVFNLADSAITIGVGLLLWQALRRRPSHS